MSLALFLHFSRRKAAVFLPETQTLRKHSLKRQAERS